MAEKTKPKRQAAFAVCLSSHQFKRLTAPPERSPATPVRSPASLRAQNKAKLGEDGVFGWVLRGMSDADTLNVRPDGNDRRGWRFDSRVEPE
jgi:hypothetical protein